MNDQLYSLDPAFLPSYDFAMTATQAAPAPGLPLLAPMDFGRYAPAPSPGSTSVGTSAYSTPSMLSLSLPLPLPTADRYVQPSLSRPAHLGHHSHHSFHGRVGNLQLNLSTLHLDLPPGPSSAPPTSQPNSFFRSFVNDDDEVDNVSRTQPPSRQSSVSTMDWSQYEERTAVPYANAFAGMGGGMMLDGYSQPPGMPFDSYGYAQPQLLPDLVQAGYFLPDAPAGSLLGSETEKPKGKQHTCPVCCKHFSRPSSLSTHMATHTGERPHMCMHPDCGRRFSVKSNLKRHLKTHEIRSTDPYPVPPRSKLVEGDETIGSIGPIRHSPFGHSDHLPCLSSLASSNLFTPLHSSALCSARSITAPDQYQLSRSEDSNGGGMGLTKEALALLK